MDRLAPLVESFLTSAEELKASAEELKGKIDKIERVIEKQGIGEMAPGTVVDKPFCDVEHAALKTQVCNKATKLEVAINRKLYMSWLILFGLLSWFGMEIRNNSHLLTELFKK